MYILLNLIILAAWITTLYQLIPSDLFKKGIEHTSKIPQIEPLPKDLFPSRGVELPAGFRDPDQTN